MMSYRSKRPISLVGDRIASHSDSWSPLGQAKYNHAFWAPGKAEGSTMPQLPQCHWFIGALLICALLLNGGCALFVQHRYYLRPSPGADSPFGPGAVSRARQTLQTLSQKPHIVGTHENEIVTRDFLLGLLNKIKDKASDEVNIEIDVQHPCGSYNLEFLNKFTNVYCDITNIVVRLSLKKQGLPQKPPDESPSALLVNAHFDSFLTSPGGSDDGLGVALMIEVLRLMSMDVHKDSRPGRLQNPVIFLFNGAEEANLEGAHGFITQHKWAKSVRALINLESIGAGGRELLFQCNSPWIAQVYADSAPYPHSSGIAHELFQLVLWRAAATDWRSFIEFGPPAIAGTDSAYVENGYVYHTTFDTAAAIDDGTIMNTGSNLLQFSSALSAAPELGYSLSDWAALNNMKLSADGKSIESPFDSHFIFFDYLGFFQVVYSGWEITTVHFGGVILALAVCWMKLPDAGDLKRVTAHAFFLQLMCVSGTALLGALYAVLAPMRWYSGGHHYASFVFIPPVLLIAFIMRQREIMNNSFGSNEVAMREISGLLQWAVALTVTTLVGHRGSYLCLLWVICGSASLMCRTVGAACFALQEEIGSTAESSSGGKRVFVDVLAGMLMIPAAAAWMYQLTEALELVVPLLGKTGAFLVGDILLGLLYGGLISSFLRIPVIDPMQSSWVTNHVKHNSKRVQVVVIYPLVALIVGTLLYSSFFTMPYSAERPKRLWLHHLERDMTGRGEGVDSGLWVVGFDSLGLSPLSSSPEVASHLDGSFRTSSFRGRWLPGESPVASSQASSRIPSASEHWKGYNCGLLSGECYLYWPYYFPVAEVLPDAYYIPAPPPKFSGSPDDESGKPLVVTSKTSEVVGGKRTVSLFVSGPGHMDIALRDDKGGSRVLKWGFLESIDESTKSALLERPIEMVATPSSRMDGVHFLQIGFGLCSGSCLLRMEIEIEGGSPVDVSVYGHYVLMKSAELSDLARDLPTWARGAEWTNFVSKLISTRV